MFGDTKKLQINSDRGLEFSSLNAFFKNISFLLQYLISSQFCAASMIFKFAFWLLLIGECSA